MQKVTHVTTVFLCFRFNRTAVESSCFSFIFLFDVHSWLKSGLQGMGYNGTIDEGDVQSAHPIKRLSQHPTTFSMLVSVTERLDKRNKTYCNVVRAVKCVVLLGEHVIVSLFTRYCQPLSQLSKSVTYTPFPSAPVYPASVCQIKDS